jgi:hypothetical protein
MMFNKVFIFIEVWMIIHAHNAPAPSPALRLMISAAEDGGFSGNQIIMV